MKLGTFFSNKTQKLQMHRKMVVTVAEPNNSIEVTNADGVGGIEYEVCLDDNLWSNLKWNLIDNKYNVAHVQGSSKLVAKSCTTLQHSFPDPAVQVFLDRLKNRNEADNVSESTAYGHKGNSFMAIGVIRMPELKRRLKDIGFNAEFKGEGTLVVEETIAIKKVDERQQNDNSLGDIIIDGQVGPIYYKVRDCIREMLAFIS